MVKKIGGWGKVRLFYFENGKFCAIWS